MDAVPEAVVIEVSVLVAVDDVVSVAVSEEEVLLHPARTSPKAIGNRMVLFIGGFELRGD